MRQLFIAFFSLALLHVGCNNPQNQETTDSHQETAVQPAKSDLENAAHDQLMVLLHNYYDLKDALVATSAEKAGEAAKKVTESAEELKSAVATSKPEIVAQLDTVSEFSRKIETENDPTTENQRAAFEKVSDALFALVKTVNLQNAGVYRQYCPMAFDDKGAYWLSAQEEIRNPYFGKKMLECGEVTDSLK